MTNIQVAYAQHMENARHQVETEREANRHALVTEAETAAHNREAEREARKVRKETKRSNKAQEKLKSQAQAEAKRHALVTESQGQQQIDETKRHDEASESISLTSAQIAAQARIAAAQIAAASAQTVAGINAQMNLAISEANNYQKKLDRDASLAKNAQNVASQKQIAQAKNLTDKFINSSNLAQKAVSDANWNNVQKQYISLKKLELEVDKKFKENKISNEQYEILRKTFETLFNSPLWKTVIAESLK